MLCLSLFFMLNGLLDLDLILSCFSLNNTYSASFLVFQNVTGAIAH